VADFATRTDATGNTDLEQRTIQNPHFEDLPGFRPRTICLSQRLHRAEDAPRAAEDLRHTATLVAEAVSDVSVDVLIPRTGEAALHHRATVIEHRVDAWAIDPITR